MAMDVDEQEFGLEVQAGNLSFGIRAVLDSQRPSQVQHSAPVSSPSRSPCGAVIPQGRCSIS
jgi:hypothetical protein